MIQNRRGIKINRPKTIAAAFGAIALTLIALAVLYWGLITDRAVWGGIGFLIVFGTGFTAMTIALNRWRPPVPRDDS
jgi:hypothetical protein